ncbi:MAG TPA: phospholipid carrier-dependent glycosyltransferase [Candidatus Binataceae bacterium]|nr:phospholipid carrier-dependent glycosyltransferase [Candidatus Binataceae bacterium]
MYLGPQKQSRQLHAAQNSAIALVTTLLAGFAIYLAYINLGHYDDFYDSGVYLESARMMIRGGHLYATIFDSQPPLWLPLVYGSMRLFGISYLAGQLLSATAGLIVVMTAGLIAHELSDWPGAWIAAAILILSPMELQWSRTVSPEVPESAFAVAGMACGMRYVRSGSRGALVMASAMIGAAVLVKLLGLFTLPALILAIGVRHLKTLRAKRSQLAARDTLLMTDILRLKEILPEVLIDSSLVIGSFAAVILCALLMFGPVQTWRQAVEFHWAARSAISSEAMPSAAIVVAQFFANDRLLGLALMFAIIGVVAVPEGLILGGWTGFTAAGLLYHRPLFSHHVVVLIPPIAIAAGVGWSAFWRGLLRKARYVQVRHSGIKIATAGLAIAVGSAIAMGFSIVAVHQAVGQVRLVRQVTTYAADMRAAQLIVQLSGPESVILTDAQGIAFIAGRDVPPQLSDTSLVRIASGYLTTAEVIRASEESGVQLFLSWSGRLSLLPGLAEWARRRFPYHLTLGNGHELYSMRPVIGRVVSRSCGQVKKCQDPTT